MSIDAASGEPDLTAPQGALSESPWLPLDKLDEALAGGEAPLALFQALLGDGDALLRARFENEERVEVLVRERARLIDALLMRAWRHKLGAHSEVLCLMAVGGYGRGELLPASDVDLMILMPDRFDPEPLKEALSDFITFLWDVGLEIGHSIRTLADCRREAKADITVTTALMEARPLCGPAELSDRLADTISPARLWPVEAFFEAKLEEQVRRHHRYHDTAYNLEPNVKGSPGGLRDIQTIAWVTQRQFSTRSLAELVEQGFLTGTEYQSLLEGQRFLWRIRFGLHLLAGRREDRLLFDSQLKLAGMFGYEDATYTLAVEQFMQRYYRTVKELSRLNEMLLQLLREAVTTRRRKQSPTVINERFHIERKYLAVRDEGVFARDPCSLLELFLVMQDHQHLRGVSAGTIRLVRSHLHLIDEQFRQNPRNHRMFLQILRAPVGVVHELRRMNRYGVLGLYIPSFGRIVGRMQYDLFHTYTVDEHTLFVVNNIRRFALTRFDHEYPYCSEIMQALPKPEVAYLGALFHDIAKGRGGDHSELGAVDAEAFCLEQGLSQYDARLVAWLVRHHLLLSVTAQKKDISDPQVLNEFARIVQDQTHLDYLYVLTVADVRATNPELWNSWKASLFTELYQLTRQTFRRGLTKPVDREQLIEGTQSGARRALRERGIEGAAVDKVWQHLDDEYFLRHGDGEVAWHTRLLADVEMSDGAPDQTLVAVRRDDARGGTSVFVFTPYEADNLACCTAVMDELGLSVLDARISRLDSGYSLDSYMVLEADGGLITDATRLAQLQSALRDALSSDKQTRVTRKASRQVRMFATATEISFLDDGQNQRTIMELVSRDRPGLIFDVANVLNDAGILLHTARITTLGERAEDVFYLTTADGQPLSAGQRTRLQSTLLERLADQLAASG